MDEKKTAWERLKLVHTKGRPTIRDYIPLIFTDFYEMHGDRFYGDDKAVIGGVARLDGMPVTVIAQVKGRDIDENKACNFAMPLPEGYRKALRLAKQAEKFHRPVICFIDTPGAYAGVAAEERGQGEAIARNLYEMSSLKVPVLSIIISEAGSGGALAVAVSDEVWMFENAIYAILSPEGYASILWKDSKRASEAAAEMKLTAEDMKEKKIVEKIIAEPEDLCKDNIETVVAQLREGISGFIGNNLDFDGEELAKKRYDRYRSY
jgi:acetyl-CoA carboxylase carboxyl transferase subunit alpha